MHYGERFNSITHTVGAALAAAGGALLVVVASRSGDPWRISGISVYASTLLLLYVSSALYHSLRGPAKNVFRKIDYCAIYLLIAGTYTPFAAVSLRPALGRPLLAAMWVLALAGIAQELWLASGKRHLSLVFYVVMGWIGILVVKPLFAALGLGGFLWLAAGGMFYTLGIAFYVTDDKLRHGHGIWHLFVLAGSICHFVTILRYVA